tara:strand:- start:4229 stop:6160 length:1932 start_codon:yes stop_codon:yes gene_type:complete
MASILKQRRDTEGNWEALNPVIPDGQLCFDITNNLFKIGDGINVYTALPVQSGTPGVGAYNEATGLSEGLMSISHHNKLDGIEEGAEVNALADWNSSSGDNKILNKPNIEYQAPIGSGNGKLVPALGTAGHFLKHDGSFGLPNYSPAVSISSIPTDSAINSAISSGWAFDNVKTAVPVNALFIDTVYDDTSIQTEVSANTAHSASTHAPSNAQANVAEVNNLTSAVTWVNVPDANITQASVTQHQAALSIAESQISDLGTYSTATGVSNNADVTSSNACNSPNVVQSDYTTGADVTANNACNSPNIEQSSVTGNAGGLSTTLVTSSGGTGLSSIGTAGQSLKVNAGATALEWGSGGLDNAGVIGKVLTGIDVSTTADVVATDTIVAAIGKLENRVATNDDKFSFPGLGTSSSTALAGNTALLQLGTSSSTALAGNTALLALGTSSSTALAGNTALLALGTSSSTALAGNTSILTLGTTSGTALAGNTSIISLSDSQTFTGTNQINSRKFPITSAADGDAVGDIMYIGSGTTVLGRIYNLIAGTWTLIDGRAVSSSVGLLAVALGTSPTTHGMLIRGTVTLSLNLAGSSTIGGTIYLGNGATTGAATNTIPTASGDVVRVVGYSLATGNDMVWFNPDSTYIEIA